MNHALSTSTQEFKQLMLKRVMVVAENMYLAKDTIASRRGKSAQECLTLEVN